MGGPEGVKDPFFEKRVDVSFYGIEFFKVAYAGEIDWDNEDAIVNDLTAIAIVGIQDPVRPGKSFFRSAVFFVFLSNCSELVSIFENGWFSAIFCHVMNCAELSYTHKWVKALKNGGVRF